MKINRLLLSVLKIQSPSYQEERMINFIKSYCKLKNYNCVVKDKNVYVTKGDGVNFPCYVAHTDTCASFVPDNQFSIATIGDDTVVGFNYIKNKFTQVGFDDKIGIFIALSMLERIDYGKAFFPYAEEVGCIGTGKADMDFFEDCGYVIQCDRRDSTGIVKSVYGVPLMSKEFGELLLSDGAEYKRKLTTGMLTDVYKLKTKGLKVSCTNLECGYYNPHREDDYCIYDQVMDTLEFVNKVHDSAFGLKFEHIYEEPKYEAPVYVHPYNYNRFDRYTKKDKKKKLYDPLTNTYYDKPEGLTICECCGEDMPNNKRAEYHVKSGLYLCTSCELVYGSYYGDIQ